MTVQTSQSGWWAKIKKPLLIVLLIVVPVVVVLYLLAEVGYAYPWTGFAEYNPSKAPAIYQRAKTTWDWLQLLIFPLIIGSTVSVIAFFFNRTLQENAREATEKRAETERKIAEERAETERKIAEQRAQDAILEAYVDRLEKLLLDNQLRKSKLEDEVRDVARSRTLTALRRLEGVRKGIVIQFLNEARLITTPDAIVQLGTADLRSADLGYLDLSSAHLEITDLRCAVIAGAWLERASLERARLQGANLHKSSLREANLRGAELQGANLTGANLFRADLDGANLTGADLAGAFLQNARGLTDQQLAAVSSLVGTTMPDGSKHE